MLIAPGAGLMYSRVPAWEVAGLGTPPFYTPWEPLTLRSNAPLQVRLEPFHMRASTSSCERGICHVVVTLLDSTGIDTCTGSVTGLVLAFAAFKAT